MDVDSEKVEERGTGDGVEAGKEVANDRSGRHDEPRPRVMLHPGGLHLKLSLDTADGQRQRGQDESSAGTRTPDTPDFDLRREDPDRERDRDKGRKRRKYRRVRPNKKVLLWRRQLAEAAATGRDGSSVSPRSVALSGRVQVRSNAALPAPNNTTQFIMEDHTDLQDLDLEAQRGGFKTTRARDSSFSIDSDEDLSSSPEDEAYLSKEFSNTYEDVHVERLCTMSKRDLIQEYLQLEQHVNVLETKLKTPRNTSSGTGDSGGNGGTGTDSDSEIAEGEMPMEPAVAEKIRIFQEEIQKLVVENQQLLQDNQRLQSSSSLVRPSSTSLSSSIDSESDSSTSSGSSSTTSSSGHSRASRSSRSSGIGKRTSPESTSGGKVLDIEMSSDKLSDNPIAHSADQEMETDNTLSTTSESPHPEKSVGSSLAAH